MKKHLLGLCMLLSFIGYAQAQSIKGVVISAQDSSVVEFAPVALLSLPDSAIKAGIQTEVGGTFSIDNVVPGKYLLRVTYVGFSPSTKEITVNKSDKTIQLDTIRMSEFSKELNEVVVNGERIKGKELVDRTIFTIPNTVAKSSANGYDILKKIPSVQVDFQNNITLNGNSNFLIQVDGKQRDKEFLSKLLPTDIETIEIINNPSGKYEGTIDGIINVTLKKEARFGMNGNVDLNFRPAKKPSIFGSGSLDYSTGKANYYISAFSFNQGLDVMNESKNIYKANAKLPTDSITFINSTGGLKVSSTSINTGVDYYINDKNNLSFNVNYRPIRQNVDVTGLGEMPYSRTFKNESTSNNSGTNSDETNISLFYKHQYEKPIQELTSETNVYYFKSDDKNNFDKKLINYISRTDTSTDFVFNQLSESKRRYISSKLDYVQPLGFSSRIEFGYQTYYQDIDYNVETNGFNTDDYSYAEFRNAAYAGYTLNVDKIGFQTNLRAENSDISINSAKGKNYTCFLPSANLQYKFTSSQNLKFTYNRRINRPSTGDLNETQKIGSDLNYSKGNINLKPEYRDKLQLTYTLNMGSSYISPNIYYEVISNKIDRVTNNVPNSNALITSPDNILTGYEQGAGLSAMLWFVNINARYYKGHYDAFQNANTNIKATDFESYSINSYAFAPIPGKINAFAFVGYNGPSKTAFTKTESMPFYGFGARKELGNHSFGFFYLLPFSKTVTFSKTTTDNDQLHSVTKQKFDVSYYIQFSYSYKFHQGRSVKKINRKAEVESDSKAGGIGQ